MAKNNGHKKFRNTEPHVPYLGSIPKKNNFLFLSASLIIVLTTNIKLRLKLVVLTAKEYSMPSGTLIPVFSQESTQWLEYGSGWRLI